MADVLRISAYDGDGDVIFSMRVHLPDAYPVDYSELGDGLILHPTHRAGMTPIMAALLGRKETIALWLINNGADLTATDRDGFSVFSWACTCGSPALVNRLIDHVPADHLTQPGAYDNGRRARVAEPPVEAIHCGRH